MDNPTPPSTFMEPNQQPDSHANPEGVAPHDSASFSTVPKDSENFRSARNDSERIRNVPQISERKENHTLTVREVARKFEAAGVARTERSIVNWCQFNSQGVARLDAYFEVMRSPWDTAAGALLVLEAGGAVTWTEHTEIVASGRAVHAPLLAVLRAGHENPR